MILKPSRIQLHDLNRTTKTPGFQRVFDFKKHSRCTTQESFQPTLKLGKVAKMKISYNSTTNSPTDLA
jgi:hypothetical protein